MRRTGGLVALVLALAALTACSDDGDGGDASMATIDDAIEAEEASAGASVARDADESTASATGGSGGGGGGTMQLVEPLPPLGASVVRTADLRIEVEKGEFATRLRAASMLARSLGGFVQSSNTTSFDEGAASGELTIRVPVDRYDDAMAQLAELGTMEQQSEDGEDVTGELVDLEARLRALRAEEDALNALMAEAANVNEILSIRSTATGIRQQIEQLAAQQASLQDRSAFSTIRVVLHESSAVLAESGPSDDWTLARAFETAVDAAVAIVGSMIVAVGVAMPLLPFALLGWYLVRRSRRSGKDEVHVAELVP